MPSMLIRYALAAAIAGSGAPAWSAGIPDFGTKPRRATLEVIKRALESAGVEFIDENGGGAGVRLREPRSLRGRRK